MLPGCTPACTRRTCIHNYAYMNALLHYIVLESTRTTLEWISVHTYIHRHAHTHTHADVLERMTVDHACQLQFRCVLLLLLSLTLSPEPINPPPVTPDRKLQTSNPKPPFLDQRRGPTVGVWHQHTVRSWRGPSLKGALISQLMFNSAVILYEDLVAT